MRKISFVTVVISFIATILLFVSCKKGITENGGIIDEVKVKKTPREMIWTADTLTSPDPNGGQLMMENILVFATNDVWVCGWNDIARGLIWHYDGKKWSESNIMYDVGGMRVNDIAGYSSNDLWTCGYSGGNIFLAHYNGSHWTRADDMGIKGELLDMCKDSSGNLWACGRNGVIMKYDKTRWIADTIKINHPIQSFYFLNRIEYYKNKIWANSHVGDSKSDTYHYLAGTIYHWSILDSMRIDQPSSTLKWGQWSLFASEFGKLYSVGLAGIWSFNNYAWDKIFTGSGTIYGMSGPSENYLVAVGDFQKVLFYNGNGWENIANLFPQISFNNIICRSVWSNGYETFIIGYGSINGSMRSIVFHGK